MKLVEPMHHTRSRPFRSCQLERLRLETVFRSRNVKGNGNMFGAEVLRLPGPIPVCAQISDLKYFFIPVDKRLVPRTVTYNHAPVLIYPLGKREAT